VHEVEVSPGEQLRQELLQLSRVLHDGRPGPGVAQDEDRLLGGARGVDGHARRPGHQGAEVGDHPLETGGSHDGHPIPGPDAQGAEPRRDLPDLKVRFLPAQIPPGAVHLVAVGQLVAAPGDAIGPGFVGALEGDLGLAIPGHRHTYFITRRARQCFE
jgi:hypothetical protein